MELSRKRMYAERSDRNRSILLYTAGSVSLSSWLWFQVWSMETEGFRGEGLEMERG